MQDLIAWARLLVAHIELDYLNASQYSIRVHLMLPKLCCLQKSKRPNTDLKSAAVQQLDACVELVVADGKAPLAGRATGDDLTNEELN